MASFHAELHVEGHAYPVWFCDCAFHQATDARGRVSARVRHGSLHLALDVPDDNALLAWATAPFKPLAGEVVFYDATRLVAHETIAFAAGQCVGYHETFESGADGPGSYRCQLTITAPAFELRAGGPAAAAAVVEQAQRVVAVVPAQLALKPILAPESAPSGSQYLSLAQEAFSNYSQQLPAALQTLQEVLGEFGQVQGRAKSPESAANRIQRAVDNGWASQISNKTEVLDNLWDAVGTRVVLHDSSPDTMSRLTSKLVAAINNGQLNVVKIENLYGADANLPYLSPENTAEILDEANLKVTQKPYESGYTATTIFVKYPGGVRGEIQLIGQNALEIANAEHLVYDAFLNKPYLGSYSPKHQGEVESQVAPIRAGAVSLNPSQKSAYMQYLSGSYANARRSESGQPMQSLNFPPEVPPALKVTNLVAVNKQINTFKLPS